VGHPGHGVLTPGDGVTEAPRAPSSGASAVSAVSAAPAAVRAIVLGALGSAPRLGPVRLVAVDGPAGSGKTTLAAALGEAFAGRGVDCAVLHLDDLYEGWAGLEGSLWPRLAAQVLEPLRRGRPGRYQRYDWLADAFDGWVDLPVPGVLVLEGCGAARREVDPLVVQRVWVQAPPEVRLERGLARDGEAARPHWERWMRDEAAHFARERTAERADVRLDGFGRMGG
jgi:uridine kinase